MVIDCFDYKISIFQQTVVRVCYILKFLKQCKFGVSGIPLDNYQKFLSVFTSLLQSIVARYNKQI